MRINKLDIGLETVSHWREIDDVHLPGGHHLPPAFVPVQSDLDEILARPSLDQRLVILMQPQSLDPELLDASVLSRTRRDVREYFEGSRSPYGQPVLDGVLDILANEIALDEEVGSALTALMRP